MALFGLWHGAQLTFILWGIYQGVFLMLHRIVQQFQQRFNLTVRGALGDLCAWSVTFLGITLGWILFRAKDIHEAMTMFGAILSPASYRQLELSRSYYGLLITLVIGYFAYHAVLGTRYFREIEDYLQTPSLDPRFLQLCWLNRWWGLGPMIVMLGIFTGLMVFFQSAGVTPFIYAGF